MKERKLIVNFPVLLVCLFTIVGCDNAAKERDKAVAEAEKANAELAKVRAVLEQTQKEKEQLSEEMAGIYKKWETDKAELAAADMQAQDEQENRIEELTQQRDETIAAVEELRAELKEKTKEIRELERRNKELRLTVQKLQNQLEQMYDQQGEESYGEPNEQGEEEIADENNV